MYELEKIKVQSLHHKTPCGGAVAWADGRMGADVTFRTGGDLSGSQAGGRTAGQLHAAEMPLNFAMPAVELVWPAAALLAWKGGMPLHLAICAGAPEDPCAKFLRTGRLPGGLSDRTREAAGVILEIIGAPEQAALAGRARRSALRRRSWPG